MGHMGSAAQLMSSNRPKLRLLFVCMGNICRSPALEATMRHLLEKKGNADAVCVDSCGLKDFFVGSKYDPKLVEAAHHRGICIEGKARVFTSQDFEKFDYIFVVDKSILQMVKSLAKTQKFSSKVFLATAHSQLYPNEEMPDPFCGGEQGFELTLDMAEDACRGIMKEFHL